MKKMVCDLCGSNAFTKEGDFFACDYCRTKYTVAEARKMMVEGTVKVDRANEIPNLLTLARSALNGENPDEAYSYANRALEINSESSDAWLLKGKAAGWSSTMVNLRLNEMVGAFRSAEQFTATEDREALRGECADVMNSVATAIHNISWSHTEQFVQVDNTWPEHIGRCQQIFPVLKAAYEWGGKREPLDNTVTIASNLVTGIKYNDFEGASRVVFLNPEYERQMRELIEATATELRKLDLSYAPPQPEAVKPNACFVVTATMGNETNGPVTMLRTFRDDVLSKSNLGRCFIRWYYVNGPPIADVIAPSYLLRGLALVFIVAPGTALAWVALRLRSRQN